MQKLRQSGDSLSNLIRTCEYYDLSEKDSIELINGKLSKPISRSTYYNYKEKLYQDEKFQSLKKSIYKSKLLKSLLLYMDDENANNLNGLRISKRVSEQYPEKKDVFQISDEQLDEDSRLYNKIKSNFCIPDYRSKIKIVNFPRLVGLPKNYTIREEYVRCGKEKMNKCKSCPHGPYYYAYWREKLLAQNRSILKKRYLGTIDPKL